MFKWIKWFSVEKKVEDKIRETSDQMEEALWEIKEVYDLETEEVDRVVYQKRDYAEKIRLRNKKQYDLDEQTLSADDIEAALRQELQENEE